MKSFDIRQKFAHRLTLLASQINLWGCGGREALEGEHNSVKFPPFLSENEFGDKMIVIVKSVSFTFTKSGMFSLRQRSIQKQGYSFIHTLIHLSFLRLFVDVLMIIQSLVHEFFLFYFLFIDKCIIPRFMLVSIHPSIHLSNHSFIHSFIHLFIH